MKIAEKASKRTRNQIELSARFKDRMWDVYEENKHRYPKGFRLSGAFSKKYCLRQWYRIFELGNNPTFYTICGLAEIMQVPPSALLDFDFSKEIRHVSHHPYCEIVGGWNKRHF
jgi:hypothetical protein